MSKCIHDYKEQEDACINGLCPICLQQENEKLKKFARRFIKQECWHIEYDGGEIQDYAEELGLIEKHIATKEDVSEFDWFEVGDTIYKFTEILDA